MFLYEDGPHSYIFHNEPINQWAPAPLFTNDPLLHLLTADVTTNCPFWMLKLTSFEDFLVRRSKLASQPKKHFPTQQTYPREARKISCKLDRVPLRGNAELFCRYYDQWKLSKYGRTGEDIMTQFFHKHDRVPEDWLYVHALREERGGSIKGVCFMIEDGRSCSVFNLASERAHGRFMLVESIKQCCDLRYSTYDCGVTRMYGDYKSVIFLDRMETENGIPSFLPGSPPSPFIRNIDNE